MKLLQQTYRVTKEQNAKVKKTAKTNKQSESQIIRNLIETL